MGKKDVDKIVGAAYEDLNAEEMQNTQGAGDVDAETTPVIISVAVSAATGIVSAIKNK